LGDLSVAGVSAGLVAFGCYSIDSTSWWRAAIAVGCAADHGLSRLRMSASGPVVASVEHRRGYVHVVRYEREADAVLGAHVDVVSNDVLDTERWTEGSR
jgi:hypothetical protein